MNLGLCRGLTSYFIVLQWECKIQTFWFHLSTVKDNIRTMCMSREEKFHKIHQLLFLDSITIRAVGMLFPTHKKKEGETKGKSKQETERQRPVVIGYWEIQLEAEQVKAVTFPARVASSPHWVTHQAFRLPLRPIGTMNGSKPWLKGKS